MGGTNRSLPGALAALAEFLHDEAVGGVAALVASSAAMIWANPAPDGYMTFWHQTLMLGSGGWPITEDLQHWVNDGLVRSSTTSSLCW